MNMNDNTTSIAGLWADRVITFQEIGLSAKNGVCRMIEKELHQRVAERDNGISGYGTDWNTHTGKDERSWRVSIKRSDAGIASMVSRLSG